MDGGHVGGLQKRLSEGEGIPERKMGCALVTVEVKMG